ncbi:hypothetical protein BDV40DRAFT_258248 [Aspergillus tamarii]|uniref:Uncharacterized protein n=1 Tax=Aspergillus tamarii TaxID=41984 RepID=A0A5N6V3U6_ASPTM|nr:hypothetical protein BDV40DRAFT_258248 [Aspergillus tamarii]
MKLAAIPLLGFCLPCSSFPNISRLILSSSTVMAVCEGFHQTFAPSRGDSSKNSIRITTAATYEREKKKKEKKRCD